MSRIKENAGCLILDKDEARVVGVGVVVSTDSLDGILVSVLEGSNGTTGVMPYKPKRLRPYKTAKKPLLAIARAQWAIKRHKEQRSHAKMHRGVESYAKEIQVIDKELYDALADLDGNS